MPNTRAPTEIFERQALAANGVVSGASASDPGGAASAKLKDYHLEVIRLLATLHKRFLDEIKSELDRLGVQDINNIQTLLLVHIGAGSPSISDLIHRGYYVGSNISYNVKKLIENGYLIGERSIYDQRSTRVRLSERARLLVEVIDPVFELHGHSVQFNDLDRQVMADVIDKLRMLERFWPHSTVHSGR